MNEYSIAPRVAVAEHLKTVDFDGSVVITYDSHTGMATNWWHFSGHDGSLGIKELSDIARQLASQTAEALKENINNPNGRAITIEKPRVAKLHASSKSYTLLFGIGIALKKGAKRHLWLRCDWAHQQCSLVSLYWSDGLALAIGPLYFAAYLR